MAARTITPALVRQSRMIAGFRDPLSSAKDQVSPRRTSILISVCGNARDSMSRTCHSCYSSEGTARGLSYQCVPHVQGDDPIPHKVRWQMYDKGWKSVHMAGGYMAVPATVGPKLVRSPAAPTASAALERGRLQNADHLRIQTQLPSFCRCLVYLLGTSRVLINYDLKGFDVPGIKRHKRALTIFRNVNYLIDTIHTKLGC